MIPVKKIFINRNEEMCVAYRGFLSGGRARLNQFTCFSCVKGYNHPFSVSFHLSSHLNNKERRCISFVLGVVMLNIIGTGGVLKDRAVSMRGGLRSRGGTFISID